jgi:hypothetical protein
LPVSNPVSGGPTSLPLVVLRKTYNVLMGPPSHLVALMLRIAVRICSGEWKGEEIGFTNSGRAVPVRWDYSDNEPSNEWSRRIMQ